MYKILNTNIIINLEKNSKNMILLLFTATEVLCFLVNESWSYPYFKYDFNFKTWHYSVHHTNTCTETVGHSLYTPTQQVCVYLHTGNLTLLKTVTSQLQSLLTFHPGQRRYTEVMCSRTDILIKSKKQLI